MTTKNETKSVSPPASLQAMNGKGNAEAADKPTSGNYIATSTGPCNSGCGKCQIRRSASKLDSISADPLKVTAELEQNGAVILQNLATPANAVEYIQRTLGVKLTLQPQGTWFTEVRSTEEHQFKSDALSNAALPPHTDGNSLSKPPCLAALFCRVQSSSPEPTLLFDFLKFVRTCCSAEEIGWLQTHHHLWSHSFQADAAGATIGPILSFQGANPIVRFSANLLLKGESSPDIRALTSPGFSPSPMILSINTKLTEYSSKPCNTVAAYPEAGETVVIANSRWVHFRPAIKDAENRWFTRSWFNLV